MVFKSRIGTVAAMRFIMTGMSRSICSGGRSVRT